MTNDPVIEGNPLAELLSWLDELDRADSYAGFTFNEWLARKPAGAIQALKNHTEGAAHG